MKSLARLSLGVALVGAALGLTSLGASAAPVNFSAATTLPVNAAAAPVHAIAWVCGPYRCWHRPGPAYWRPQPHFYGGPAYWRPHRHWGYGPRYGW